MTRETKTFFQPGPSTDAAYRNIRDHDHPRHEQARAYCDSLWQGFRHLADSHFLEDAKNHFQERFWEMYLGVTLLEWGFPLQRSSIGGPDFCIQLDGRAVWIEASAPGPGTGPDHVPEPILGQANRVPTDKILLRYTSAALDKAQQFNRARARKIVGPNDSYILALNCASIPYARYGDTMPYFLRAFLPIGPLQVALNPHTAEVIESSYQYRDQLAKERGSFVSTLALLESQLGPCCGVLHSSVDCVNRPNELGGDFDFLHSPSLPVGPTLSVPLRCRRQYHWRGDHVQVIPRISDEDHANLDPAR